MEDEKKSDEIPDTTSSPEENPDDKDKDNRQIKTERQVEELDRDKLMSALQIGDIRVELSPRLLPPDERKRKNHRTPRSPELLSPHHDSPGSKKDSTSRRPSYFEGSKRRTSREPSRQQIAAVCDKSPFSSGVLEWSGKQLEEIDSAVNRINLTFKNLCLESRYVEFMLSDNFSRTAIVSFLFELLSFSLLLKRPDLTVQKFSDIVVPFGIASFCNLLLFISGIKKIVKPDSNHTILLVNATICALLFAPTWSPNTNFWPIFSFVPNFPFSKFLLTETLLCIFSAIITNLLILRRFSSSGFCTLTLLVQLLIRVYTTGQEVESKLLPVCVYAVVMGGILTLQYIDDRDIRRYFYTLSFILRCSLPEKQPSVTEDEVSSLEDAINYLEQVLSILSGDLRFLPVSEGLQHLLEKCLTSLTTGRLFRSKAHKKDIRKYLLLYSGNYAFQTSADFGLQQPVDRSAAEFPSVTVRSRSFAGIFDGPPPTGVPVTEAEKEQEDMLFKVKTKTRMFRTITNMPDLLNAEFNLLDSYVARRREGLSPCPPLPSEYFPSLINHSWEVPEVVDCFKNQTTTALAFSTVGSFLLHPFIDSGIADRQKVAEVLWGMQNLYLPNPYHNAMHGAQVAYASTWLSDLTLSASPLERMALVVAALGHDLGHPGRTNGYLTHTRHPLAMFYSDRSCLEMYHSAMLFHLLEYSHCDLTSEMTREDSFQFRRLIIDLILATDMSLHFELISQFKVRQKSPEQADEDPSEEDRRILMKILIKAGDLSHMTFRWDSHIVWSTNLLQEFFAQGNDEKLLGLPVSPLCDRESTEKGMPASQVVFIKFITEPIYISLIELDDTNRIKDECLNGLNQNLDHWEKLKEQEEIKCEEENK